MRGKHDPDWAELIQSWRQTQADLRSRLIVRPLRKLPRFVAGVDAAISPDHSTMLAAAVVYDRTMQTIIEVATATRPLDVPYVPGFLSFREGPAVTAAIQSLKHPFGVICFDGQGYAHPRRCGLACHIAITLDIPAVGVAKSKLIGTFEEPAAEAGSMSPLLDAGEQTGSVLRTQAKKKPLFVSIGHKIDLPSAAKLVLACCTRYRLPEPTRHADREVAAMKRQFAV